MDAKTLFFLLPTCFLAAFVQSSCGMGFTTLATAILPLFLPFSDAVAVSCMTALFGNITLTLRYRKHVNPKLVWIPSLSAVFITGLVIRFAPRAADLLLKRVYGGVLILIALVFIFSKHIRIRRSILNSALIGSVIGISNGFFSVGGPFMAVYLLSDPDQNKNEYIGSIQLFFLITSLSALFFRGISGLISPPVALMSLAGCLAVAAGLFLGFKVFAKIDFTLLKKFVYLLITIMGVYLVLGL